MDNEEKIYTESELLQILNGLASLHWRKNWLARLFHKPWVDALNTAAMIIAGDKVLRELDAQNAINWAEDFLDD